MIEHKLIKILNNIAYLLELKGENPFKARAYSNAAKLIKDEKINIAQAVHDESLKNLKGIGEALQKKITEFVQTGKMEYYEKLLSEIPKALVDISKINSIGFAKARMLFYEHSITSLDALEEACLSGTLAKIKGFGEKSQEYILTSIHHKKASKGKFLQQEAKVEAEKISRILSSLNSVRRFSISGDIRRMNETIGSIYFLAETDDFERTFEELKGFYPFVFNDGKIVYEYSEQIKIVIEPVSIDDFSIRLHDSSSSDDYKTALAELIKESNVSLIKISDESELYSKLNLAFVPPEMREYPITLEQAKRGQIPKLIEQKDLKGMLHVHTLWSDGIHTIKEMALAAKKLGFEYIAICDHSRTAVYTNGLTIERVILQHEEIDRLNEENLGIKILKGIESDILTDGSLDYPEEILETFDLVVASVHSSFTMSKTKMTDRIIHALASPYTHILGHPTGRLLLSRPAYEVDIKEVIDAASEYNKIIEINSNPYRLDLSWENAWYAREKGVKLAINPDSHTYETLTDVANGIQVARKAGLTKSDVVNCMGLEEFYISI